MCVPGCHETMHRALSRRGFFGGAAAAGLVATAVSPAESAQAPRQFRRVVDLTHVMSPEFPTFDGNPGIAMERVTEFKANGYNMFRWHLIEHAGTHLDAPIHFSEAGITADKIAASALVAPLAVVDVAAKAATNADYLVLRDDLVAWERRHGRLPDNCCVAMNSGWARHATDPAKFVGKDSAGVMHFPGFSAEAADWLMKERKVVGLAVDTLSLDYGASKDFKAHLTWLPSGRWGLENVANLDQVPASGATLVVGLAKIKDATGGAARLLALI
jgi:kynurenine formamidase